MNDAPVLLVLGRLPYSGKVLSTLAMALALRARGVDARVVSAGGPLGRRFADAGVPMVVADVIGARLADPLRLARLASVLADPRPALVHVMDPRVLDRAIRLARRLGVPVVATFHDPDHRAGRLKTARDLAAIVAVSESVREALVNARKVPKDEVHVIPGGIWPDAFRDLSPRTPPGPIPAIGALGPLDPVRGHEFLLRAARLLADRAVEVQIILAGAGPEEGRLKALARELGLAGSLTLAPHVTNTRQVAEAVDCVVSSALREGLGQVLLEAMACGTPVVATGVGGVYQVIEDGQTGLVVPPRNPEALAEAIGRIIGDAALAARLGAEGRQSVLSRFVVSVGAEATMTLYTEVLDRCAHT